MSAPGIRKHLRRQSRVLLFAGLVFFLGYTPLLILMCQGGGWHRAREDVGWVAVLPVCFVLIGLLLASLAVHELWRWRRHPDVLTLARYGPPVEVVAAIDAELALPGAVRWFGRFPVPWRTYVTPSWLVYLPHSKNRFSCLRLDSIVRAGRAPAGPLAQAPPGLVPAKAVFEDRYGVRLAVVDEGGSINRLLAEVLARVPGVLAHFGDEPGPEGSERVFAAGGPGRGSPDGIVG